ncbi:tail tape measure protein [Nitrososphaeria virus YSH_922147]|uniref:Tail tape measure protein n=1 Tax=Nitrososphaeria virus YSH_922147 TaxID=3071323 RepID=A0A976UAR9_9CAUD|nr:tail tape measure protein [Yangshan Harbor Nitrososphaeria virus]UVF62448.1 tail tape measure protein [Nitrososphaeria virus YSH_922147]
MGSSPLIFQLGISGSGEVKSELDRVTEAFNRAKASGGDYGKEQRALSSAVNRRINEDRLQNRLLLAQHPNLLKITRGLSTVSSITRTLLTLQNALNISKLVSQGVDTQGLQIQHDINEERRLQNDLIARGLKDSPEYLASVERLNILLNQQKERIQEVKDTKFNDWVMTLEGVIFAVSTAFLAFGKHLSSIVGFFGKLGSLTSGLLNPLTAIGTAMALIGGFIADWLVGLFGLNEWRENNGRLITEFFTQTIPQSLGQAGLFLTNFFLNDLPIWASQGLDFLKNLFETTWNSIISTTNAAINGIISGIESLSNSFISVINRMISAYNRVAKKIGLPKLSTIEGMSLPRVNIPLITAAKGFDGMVNSPTMFLTGEAGPEHVSVTPNGGSSRNGTTIIVNVQGSIMTERQLFSKLDNIQKGRLKGLGFTGY